MNEGSKKCRLCLENIGELAIFPDAKLVGSHQSHLAIPMRIAACTTLFMQANDGLPNMICCDCRLELEKSYYFRKRAAAVDVKLRQHARLMSMGKESTLSDIDDEELGLEDSVILISEMEEKRRVNLYAQWQAEVQRDLMQAIEEEKQVWIIEQKEALMKEIEEKLRQKLKDEVKLEVRAEIQASVKAECIEEAKMQLRDEIYESIKRELKEQFRQEIRKRERQALLKDLEAYLFRYEESEDTDIIEHGNHFTVENEVALQDHQSSAAYQAQESTELNSPDDLTIVSNKNTSETPAQDQDEQQSYISVEDDDDERKNEMRKDEYESELLINYQMDYSDAEEDSVYMSNDNLHYKLDTAKAGETNMTDIYKLVEEADEQDDNVVVIDIQHDNDKQDPEDSEQLLKVPSDNEEPCEQNESTQKNNINPTKTIKCELCPMMFSTISSLKRHMRTHVKCDLKGKTFQCKECKGYFSCRSSLNRHMLVHSGERPHRCPTCRKSFSQLVVLKRHVQTHSDARKFQCSFCERSFVQRLYLTEHINKFHSENPEPRSYDCHLCPKRFSHASGLSRHFAAHSGVSYQCNNCQRIFVDKSSIKRHIITVHGISDNKNIEMLQKKILPGMKEKSTNEHKIECKDDIEELFSAVLEK